MRQLSAPQKNRQAVGDHHRLLRKGRLRGPSGVSQTLAAGSLFSGFFLQRHALATPPASTQKLHTDLRPAGMMAAVIYTVSFMSTFRSLLVDLLFSFVYCLPNNVL